MKNQAHESLHGRNMGPMLYGSSTTSV